MIENGMLVNQTAYDTQCREPKTVRCACCTGSDGMLNKVILMGRFTADPELRQTPNGVSVTSFRIAVDRNFNSNDGERQADFINIVAWRQTAEFIVRYFVKGQMIALEGSIQTRSYEDKNGNKRMAVEVIAEHVWFAGGKSDNGAPARPSNPCADTTDFLEISSDSDDLPF